MIKAEFFGTDPIRGFHITGHSGFCDEGSDIICASVSSAAYMTANTLTEIIGIHPEIKISDGDLYLKIKREELTESSQQILRGFLLHLNALCEQYQKYIKVSITEV